MRKFTLIHAVTGLIGLVFCVPILLSIGYVVLTAEDDGATAMLQQGRAWVEKPVSMTHFTKEFPAPVNPVLTWSKCTGAVTYELELLAQTEDTGTALHPFFKTRQVYINGYNVVLPADFQEDTFYWRVRAIDINGIPMSSYSDLETVPVERTLKAAPRPVLTGRYNEGNGQVLLYPVYDWIPVNGAASYEIEILDDMPENPNGICPSVHRIDVETSNTGEHYDSRPRMSAKPFYWRVRALDGAGNPLGVYSDAGTFTVNPDAGWEVAAYGDSITHGGGSISYSPSDWEYSYLSYLDFPSINLAQSGDTSAMTAERFERDVLPFHPGYLLILMGSNSLRGGTSAGEVIRDMESVREKCLENRIRPVFLTLPPVNPGNIKRAFDQPTDPAWHEQIEAVNTYIHQQVCIDITEGLIDKKGNLSTEMALDGLHMDPNGKKSIADAINAAWPAIQDLPDEAWTAQDE